MKHFNGQRVTLKESREAYQAKPSRKDCLFPRTRVGLIAVFLVTQKFMKPGDCSCLKVPMFPAEAHWGEGAVHLGAACR